MEKEYTYNDIEDIKRFLQKIVTIEPTIGIICGSGLGSIGEIVSDPIIIDYKDIPNFPQSTVIGHAGRLIFGYISSIPVMCMQGRFHFYEGVSLSQCAMPVRLMKLLGVSILIVSNAAGGVNPSYKVGDIMLLKDHINFVGLTGQNPLRGSNEEKFGPRFVALNNAYKPELNQEAKIVAKNLGIEGIHEGVYCCVGGPNYETVAEVKLLRILGADAVGMSTVHEVIAAKHCGLECFAFSLITNVGIADYDSHEVPNGKEVVDVANKKSKELKKFIEVLVPRLVQVKENF